MGSNLCPQVSVIPSTSPEGDSVSFLQLFADYQVQQNSLESVTIVHEDKSVVIFCRTARVGSLPSLLLVDSRLSIVASQLMNGAKDDQAGVELLTSRNDDLSPEEPPAILLRFDGGGTLMVASKQAVRDSPPSQLAEWLTSPSSINGNGSGSADNDDMQDVALRKPDDASKSKEAYAADGELASKSPLVVTSIRAMNGKAIMEAEAPHKLPEFPTLDVKLNGAPFPLNAPVPVDIDNDLFRGKVLMLLRPPNPEQDDPYWNERIFSKRKRRFILQIQGKFKRDPRGVLYVGAEVSKQMKLGLLAKGICNLLLKFLSSFAISLHYSFGDAKGLEKSHISAPAWNSLTNVVVTKQGDTPPSLGGTIEESKEAVAARMSSNGMGQWNTTDTFTLSYHSMYLDLPTWSVMKLPFAPSLDLRTFWGKSLLNICLYDTSKQKDGRHLVQDNEYFIEIQANFLGLDGGKKDEEEEESMPWSARTRSISESNLFATGESPMNRTESDSVDPADKSVEPILEELDGEEYLFFDAEEDIGSSSELPWSPVSVQRNLPESQKLLEDINAVCPMWIDVASKGKYVKTYAINLNQRTIFRFSPAISDYFDIKPAKEAAERHWSPRLSSCERTRRIIGHLIATAKTNPAKAIQLRKFAANGTPFDSSFLRGLPPTLSPKRARLVQKSAFVARAFSDHHWIEEWVKVTDLQLSFYHPDKPQKANLRLSLRSILSVQKMASIEAPVLVSYSFMEVHTLGQRVYLMFATEELCDSWVAYLSTVIKKGDPGFDIISGGSSVSDQLINVDNPSKEFLHKSSMFDCKQRKILNCRKFSFRSSAALDPMKQVQDSLRKGLDPSDDSEERNLCSFLDSVADLKQVEVSNLTEGERTAFFLNLYHVMIVHAFLVLGPPDSTFKWISYFNAIAYQCSDDIFSLTELEHNILRAAMNYPSQFVSRFVLPKSQFRFALTKPDYRINFALNCGSLSNPASVPIYDPKTLDAQLNSASRAYLKVAEVTSQKRSGLSITLPRICVWFADDFGDGSTSAVLKLVEQYLDEPKRKLLKSSWDAGAARHNDVNVKYFAYSFECRNLTLFSDVPSDLVFTIE